MVKTLQKIKYIKNGLQEERDDDNNLPQPKILYWLAIMVKSVLPRKTYDDNSNPYSPKLE